MAKKAKNVFCFVEGVRKVLDHNLLTNDIRVTNKVQLQFAREKIMKLFSTWLTIKK